MLIRGRKISYETPRPGIRSRVGDPILPKVLKSIEFYKSRFVRPKLDKFVWIAKIRHRESVSLSSTQRRYAAHLRQEWLLCKPPSLQIYRYGSVLTIDVLRGFIYSPHDTIPCLGVTLIAISDRLIGIVFARSDAIARTIKINVAVIKL